MIAWFRRRWVRRESFDRILAENKWLWAQLDKLTDKLAEAKGIQ